MKVVALHGMPTSPRLWERLRLPNGWALRAPAVPGLGVEGTPPDWNLADTADAVRAEAGSADVLVGHDLGGVLAALVARPGQAVVLSGTALGLYWAAIRLTAAPPLHRYFYERHAGRRFLRDGALPEHAAGLLEAFGDHGPGWPARMRQVAAAMKVPPFLALRLRGCGVRLAWGRKDPWYPPPIARTIQRTTGGTLTWLDCGHFAPWEDPAGFAAVITGEALLR